MGYFIILMIKVLIAFRNRSCIYSIIISLSNQLSNLSHNLFEWVNKLQHVRPPYHNLQISPVFQQPPQPSHTHTCLGAMFWTDRRARGRQDFPDMDLFVAASTNRYHSWFIIGPCCFTASCFHWLVLTAAKTIHSLHMMWKWHVFFYIWKLKKNQGSALGFSQTWVLLDLF